MVNFPGGACVYFSGVLKDIERILEDAAQRRTDEDTEKKNTRESFDVYAANKLHQDTTYVEVGTKYFLKVGNSSSPSTLHSSRHPTSVTSM